MYELFIFWGGCALGFLIGAAWASLHLPERD